jgi:hypothetical protein
VRLSGENETNWGEPGGILIFLVTLSVAVLSTVIRSSSASAT